MKILKRSSSSCSSTSNGNTLRSRSGSGRSMVSPLEDLRSLDDAFFETYGISEADGARAGVKLAADLLSTGIQASGVCSSLRKERHQFGNGPVQKAIDCQLDGA